MATKFFTGEVEAVAQIDTVQITADDAATTYTITIGGVAVSVAGTGTGVNDTAAALKAALTLEDHPYFAAITWTVATDTVTATANVAGCPFTAASSVAGGAGTIGAVTSSTACTGPNFYHVAGNWSDGSLPGAADLVHVDTNINICWDVDDSGTTINAFTQWRNTGKIGLRHDRFATSANGDSYSAVQMPEYRDHYLKIKVDGANGKVTIGKHDGPGAPAGSGRIKIDLGNQAAQVQIDWAAAATETNQLSIRMLANSATTDVFVRSASGGFGLAVDQRDETTTVGDITISDPTTASRVVTGPGVTLSNWKQRGGTNLLQAAATVTLVQCDAGVLTTEGAVTITTWNHGKDATAYPNNTDGAGDAVVTMNNYGALDTVKNSETRTWTTYNRWPGSSLIRDKDVLTLTSGDPGQQQEGPQREAGG